MTTIQDVLDQPLITRHIAYGLNHEDRISFACLSNDERFQESISDLVHHSKFSLDVQSFFRKWEGANDDYTETLNHVTDPWMFDNVINERDTFLADRVIEFCNYLRENWKYALLSQTFVEFVHGKLIEMSDDYPNCQYACGAFILDMYDDH
jgi:hypothetical protein